MTYLLSLDVNRDEWHETIKDLHRDTIDQEVPHIGNNTDTDTDTDTNVSSNSNSRERAIEPTHRPKSRV